MSKGTRAKKPEVTERIQKEVVQKKGPIKYNIELNEEQKQAKRYILEKQITILTGKAGSGKAQPLHSKILTPSGWKTMADIKVGDEVITQSGEKTKVNGVFPQGEKEIFRVNFSDRSSTECCGEHLWNVKSNKLRNKYRGPHDNLKKIQTEYQTMELSEIVNNLYINKNRLNYNVPMVNPVKFNKNELPLDPYFLGLLIGDGGITHSISWSSEDDELISYVKSYVLKLSCSLKLKKDNKSFKEFYISSPAGQSNQITEHLRTLGLMGKKSENKFIPDIYKYSSIEDRLLILQGLMDTDGSTTGTSTTFHTSSKILRDDVIEIIRSLGGTATYNSKIPKYKYLGKTLEGKECYNISIRLCEINPFKLRRKAEKYIPKTKYVPVRYITSVENVGNMEAQCISVEDNSHLYVTDDYIITHNTLAAVATALDMLHKKEIKKVYITRPVVTREDLGFLPGDIADKLDPFLIPIYDNLSRFYNEEAIKKLVENKSIDIAPIAFMRGRTIEDGILIIDEAQNVDHESLKMCLTRIGKSGKIVVCGDTAQIDLKKKQHSGLAFLVEISSKIEGMQHMELKTNHRNPIVEEILKFYEEKEENDKKVTK